jgi:hypothetical protein
MAQKRFYTMDDSLYSLGTEGDGFMEIVKGQVKINEMITSLDLGKEVVAVSQIDCQSGRADSVVIQVIGASTHCVPAR